VVLLDWETSEDERKGTDALVAVHAESTALVWPADRVNRELGETFRGSERFLSTELVEATAQAAPAKGILRDPATGIYELLPQQKNDAKQALIEACRNRNEVGDLRIIIDLLPALESRIPQANAQLPLPGV
jgi:hypothetical protein